MLASILCTKQTKIRQSGTRPQSWSKTLLHGIAGLAVDRDADIGAIHSAADEVPHILKHIRLREAGTFVQRTHIQLVSDDNQRRTECVSCRAAEQHSDPLAVLSVCIATLIRGVIIM